MSYLHAIDSLQHLDYNKNEINWTVLCSTFSTLKNITKFALRFILKVNLASLRIHIQNKLLKKCLIFLKKFFIPTN